MIRFSIGGRTVELEKLEDALMVAVLKGLREKLRQQVGSIRDPDTGEFPTVKQAENEACLMRWLFSEEVGWRK